MESQELAMAEWSFYGEGGPTAPPPMMDRRKSIQKTEHCKMNDEKKKLYGVQTLKNPASFGIGF